MTIEQLFTRQEQAVVYLFSRYWDRIDGFKNKRICRIHTHFPDFTLADNATDLDEALEFEFGLRDFDSHIPKDLRTYVPQVVEPISPGFRRGEGAGQRP